VRRENHVVTGSALGALWPLRASSFSKVAFRRHESYIYLSTVLAASPLIFLKNHVVAESRYHRREQYPAGDSPPIWQRDRFAR
jgi:hypothetical protein